MSELRIRGYVAPGFGPVADVFRDNFERRGELGASFCVLRDGERLIDIWAGLADPRRGRVDPETGERLPPRPWEEHTISTLFSATKGVAALALLALVDRGELDPDARVADYWPAFRDGAKAGITVRTLLNHRSGLLGFAKRVRIEDFAEQPERVRRAFERSEPVWPPGSQQGYHGVTFGVFAAELFRQAHAGEASLGRFLAEEIAGPLGAEVHIGLPEALRSRVATMVPAPTWERLTKAVPKLLFSPGLEGRTFRGALKPGSPGQIAFRDPADLGPTGLHNFNAPRVQRLELPWANGLGNARGLARLYGALARGGELDGVRVVREETVAPIHERQSWAEPDAVIRKPLGWSQGFIKEEPRYFSPHREAFGHPGAGGTLGFCDPVARLGIGYVMNQMTHHVRSPRAMALCDALYRCL
ncbi:MAG TPA: serine hydrolase domain-containing protein [Polyangiaceae bacterium LLY-WYZ-15_(1-7)]|nr:serine hydrolase domain-containing protein [Polyangiaceae bacterium LLY-WYZ-15_(1-7)]HJL00018.1 serine hydrolase domain-containing protein [Polyangiaceae bacterium LLY-WYZ-15_(1-7)]HJL12451.1 serine hydrolase domain-containing protein [Polyangiaceae bacterium LLY-WYZ-15_(1-7)]HJL26571.1 serine hydrolase domain-containing protein [Polyangiaceae bacterium LLY-WYZ-15_(1-7)]HJL28739.1 serine hydrolase domain-containing protein [Polyangiaceae bacterium LLY-WYZ-15_(1-7)]